MNPKNKIKTQTQGIQKKTIFAFCILVTVNLMSIDGTGTGSGTSEVVNKSSGPIEQKQKVSNNNNNNNNILATLKPGKQSLMAPTTKFPRTHILHEKFPQYTEEDLEFLDETTDSDLEIVKKEKPPVSPNKTSYGWIELALLAAVLTILVIIFFCLIKINKCKIATYINRRSDTPEVPQADWLEMMPTGYQSLLTPDCNNAASSSSGLGNLRAQLTTMEEPEQFFNSQTGDSAENPIYYMEERQEIPYFPVCPPPKKKTERKASVSSADNENDED